MSEVKEYRQPNLTYRLGEKSVAGKIDEIESVKQAIYHILNTERYSKVIYDDDYGVELEQYIGKDIGYITADIENTLKSALTQDDRISDVVVDDVSVSKTNASACIIEFTVYTIYGEINEKLEVQT